MRILGEPLDALITGAVLTRLDSDAMTAALAPAVDDDAILEQLGGVESRRGELAQLWADGEVSRTEWSAATGALDKRQAALEEQLRETTRAAVPVDVTGLAERWPQLTNERRRAVLAAVIEAIDIAPAVRGRNWFDAGRVSVRWRA